MKKGTNLSPDAVVNLITRPQRSNLDDSESGASDPACTTDQAAPVDVDVIDVATRVAMVSPFYIVSSLITLSHFHLAPLFCMLTLDKLAAFPQS